MAVRQMPPGQGFSPERPAPGGSTWTISPEVGVQSSPKPGPIGAISSTTTLKNCSISVVGASARIVTEFAPGSIVPVRDGDGGTGPRSGPNLTL